MGEPREETPAFIREALAAARSSRSPPTRRPRGCPSCARRSRPGSRGASAPALDPDTAGRARRSAPRRRSSTSRQVLGGEPVVVPTPGLPRLRARRRLRRQARSWSCRCAEEHGFLPDLDAVPEATWRETAVLWLNYPNNPTAATAPLGALRARRRAGPRARLRAGLRRGLLRALLRRQAARLGAAARRPAQRRGLQHALQALVDARATARASWPATRS